MLLNRLLTLLFVISFIFTTGAAMASGDGDIGVVDGVVPIGISQAEQLLDQEDVYFLDANVQEVRDERGYISGAVFVDESNLQSMLPNNKNSVLVFYCLNRLCSASSVIALEAQKMGFKDVYVMIDGIEGWILSGRPVETLQMKRWNQSTNIKDFKDGIHGGLVFGVIPACRDCHGSEVDGIRVELANNKEFVNTNCSSCHEDEKFKFEASVHKEDNATVKKAMMMHGAKTDKMGEEEKKYPTCWDCHSVHTTPENSTWSMKQRSDKQCGSCHEKEQKHYYETFHGKAMYLNSAKSVPTVAACYDCHGVHNIFKVDDPKSTLSETNRITTCAECHAGANANFVSFIAHADPTDKKTYPQLYYAYIFMTSLLVAVFSFFGLHTLLWSIRLLMMRFKNPIAWKKAREEAHGGKIAIKRFTLFQRLQHFFMAASFLGLSFSGLPQKFYTASWAQSMIDFMGGPIAATQIHHVSAIVMGAVFLSHIMAVALGSWKRRDNIRNPETGKLEWNKFWKAFFGPDSLMPRKQDFTDMTAHVKWFFNKGPRPQFDRWTYWEKFDYLAVFWGMFIIGFSGLILWFPIFFSFLPGWFVNLATIIHSDEALLATGFIFAVHFFNTHFRADRFPMDMVIFSGTISKEEMLQERLDWYKRLEKSGALIKLEEESSKFNSYKLVAKIIGFAMLLTGVVFLFMIIYALLT